MFDPAFYEIFQRTPKTLDDHVLEFCRKLNPASSPVMLKPAPFRDAVPGECYRNVEIACGMSGGTEVSGWLIWYWPDVFLEAEHHMVMRLQNGLVDVTPPPDHEEAVLFLPDPSAPFNRITRKLIPSRQSIVAGGKTAPKIQAMIDAAAAVKCLSGDTFGAMVPVSSDLAHARQSAFVAAKLDLLSALRAGLGRNDPCFCGGGMKYKKCHGR